MRARRPAGARRFSIIVVLVTSMVITLFGRLYYVQVLDPNKPTQNSGATHGGVIVLPAPRGVIVSSTGQTLVGNTSIQVLTVDRETLQQRPDHGAPVLRALAAPAGDHRGRACRRDHPVLADGAGAVLDGEPVPTGAGGRERAGRRRARRVRASRGLTRGSPSRRSPSPTIRAASLAAHVLGYTGAVDAEDKKADSGLNDADTIGRSGLEESYDSMLRGVDGTQVVNSSPQGNAVGNGTDLAPIQGDTLVTSIDANVQKLAEQALCRSRSRTPAQAGKPATAGAVVVMDPQTGRVIAAASYPTYDPQHVRRRNLDRRLRQAHRAQRRTTRWSAAPSPASTRRARRSS